jgi:hypothetical protein
MSIYIYIYIYIKEDISFSVNTFFTSEFKNSFKYLF